MVSFCLVGAWLMTYLKFRIVKIFLQISILIVSTLAISQSFAEGATQKDLKVQSKIDAPKNKQAMAQSPEALLKLLSGISFYPPNQYQQKMQQSLDLMAYKFPLEQLPQIAPAGSDPFQALTAAEIEHYIDKLVGFALQSKHDGEILWGRIQGTKYERNTLNWLENRLKSFGIKDVTYDKFPSQYPQWRPTTASLKIVSSNALKNNAPYVFEHAITPFISKNTPKEGVEREVIYVGNGSAAELKGRDLTDKIILLRGTTLPSAMFNTARMAYSRVASGEFGLPAGIVVWWDTPKTLQVAGRVGAPGGGDAIGNAAPWISIGDDAGLYLRKLIDRSTDEEPVKLNMNVQGQMEHGKDRMSGNVFAKVPGKSGKYILMPAHVDGYFYGIHDNGAAVAMHLALARYYSSLPLEKREHGFIFLFQGDHEVPGVGGTLPFAKKYKQMLKNDLLMVLKSEHIGLIRPLDEGLLFSRSNTTEPLYLLVTNRSPKIVQWFLEAAKIYNIAVSDMMINTPVGDEAAFHPPFNRLNAISAGWIQTTQFYHSSADVDWNAISFSQLEKITRAHAYIIEKLFKTNRKELDEGAFAEPEVPAFKSEALQMYLGNH